MIKLHNRKLRSYGWLALDIGGVLAVTLLALKCVSMLLTQCPVIGY